MSAQRRRTDGLSLGTFAVFRGALGAYLGGLVGLVVAANHAAQALGAAERYVDLVDTRAPEILEADIFAAAAASDDASPSAPLLPPKRPARSLSQAFAAVPRRGSNLAPVLGSPPLVVYEAVAFRYDVGRADAPLAVDGVTLPSFLRSLLVSATMPPPAERNIVLAAVERAVITQDHNDAAEEQTRSAALLQSFLYDHSAGELPAYLAEELEHRPADRGGRASWRTFFAHNQREMDPSFDPEQYAADLGAWVRAGKRARGRGELGCVRPKLSRHITIGHQPLRRISRQVLPLALVWLCCGRQSMQCPARILP